MSGSSFRFLMIATSLIAVALLAGLVSLHEKHYARRQLLLLQNRVEGLERLIIEDRTV